MARALAPVVAFGWLLAGCRTPSSPESAGVTADTEAGASRVVAQVAKGGPEPERGDDPEKADRVVTALREVFPRASIALRIDITRDLLDAVEGFAPLPPQSLTSFLLELGEENPELFAVFVKALDRADQVARKIAASAVLHAWETRRAAASEVLATVSRDRLLALLFPCHLPPQRRFSREGRSVPDPSFETGLEVAAWVTDHHTEPDVRAVALSLEVFRRRDGNDVTYDLAPVARAWARDPSVLVRTAALRIAGFLGRWPGGPDLTNILLSEDDSRLLTEAIQARTLWANGPPDWRRRGFELFDGFTCDWIPPRNGPPRELIHPWQPVELARLRHLLEQRREPLLRDACSLALASRFRSIGRNREAVAPDPVRLAGFEVHEWGVWIEGDGVLRTPEKVLADLPRFVHRSTVSAADVERDRFYTPMVVTKPVVFFHTPEPTSLLVRAGFRNGRPWAFYPAATDYTEGLGRDRFALEPVSVDAAGDGPLASDLLGRAERSHPEEQRVVPLRERERVAPPWDEAASSEPGTPPAGFRSYPDPTATNPESWRQFFDTVPWLVPNHPSTPTLVGSGGNVLTAVGLEWCGLRVGYPAALEGAAPEVDSRSWWSQLRSVPCQDVAVRGERDRFLFYDGAVDLPGPVLAGWGDAERKELLIGVRPFQEFPEPSLATHGAWWLSDLEKSRARTTVPLPAVFVVWREGDTTRGDVLEGLMPASDPIRVPLERLPLGEDELAQHLARVLEQEGLTHEEAGSLLATWREDFFATRGRRIVTVMPQWMYQAVVPLEVFPVPEEMVRVGLVWKELDALEIGTGR